MRCKRLPLPGGEGGGSSFVYGFDIRMVFLPSAVAKRVAQLNQRADAVPLCRGRVHVLTRDGIFATRLRSIATLHDLFPGVFVDVNHGVAVNPDAVTEVRGVSRTKWIRLQLDYKELGAFRRPVFAKVSRRCYRKLRQCLQLPKVCSSRSK